MADTPKDVALIGLGALSGALTACGPFGGALAFLGMTLGGVLGLYGGSQSSPPPLTADDVNQIVTANLIKNDVHTAWSQISATHDWHRDWTVRAKSGETFTAHDLTDFDQQYNEAMGPNSNLRSALKLLYTEPAHLDTTPAQFGMPVFILAVGLWIELVQVGIARTAQRGETPSSGEWTILGTYLRTYQDAVHTCDFLASTQVGRQVQAQMQANPSIKIGTPAYDNLVKGLEVKYRGGASGDLDFPPATSQQTMNKILLRLEEDGHQV
jgi:hypothetical protein